MKADQCTTTTSQTSTDFPAFTTGKRQRDGLSDYRRATYAAPTTKTSLPKNSKWEAPLPVPCPPPPDPDLRLSTFDLDLAPSTLGLGPLPFPSLPTFPFGSVPEITQPLAPHQLAPDSQPTSLSKKQKREVG